MSDYVDADAVDGEHHPDFEQFPGLSWTNQDRQRMVTLIAELIDVMDHRVLDLFDRVATLEGCLSDPHAPTLVAFMTQMQPKLQICVARYGATRPPADQASTAWVRDSTTRLREVTRRYSQPITFVPAPCAPASPANAVSSSAVLLGLSERP